MKARRTIARTLTAAASAGLLALGLTSEASAASQYLWVYNSGGNCVSDYSEITTASGGTVTSVTRAWNNSCTNNYLAGNQGLAVNQMPLWFDFGSSTWIQCYQTGWFFNQGNSYAAWLVGTNVRNACGGDKWYATNTGSFAWINGAYQGGWIPSGNEWIGSGVAAAKAPEQPKISAAEAIRTGQVRIGSPTGPKATRKQLQPAIGEIAAGVPLAPKSVTVTMK
ncbi:hypothetical protein [Streptomyces sp. NPDC056944]|uniref:hypothetical protein n=1 Tax=unclassified Streptomyces TaxID=2593676 RepID=UPI00363C0D6E